MKWIVTQAAFLALLFRSSGAAAQTTYQVIGNGLNGYGCIGEGGHEGEFNILVQFQNKDAPQKGKVTFVEMVRFPKQEIVCLDSGHAVGDVVYRLNTDNNLQTFKIEKFCPNKELVVCSPGLCGGKRDTIKATITPNQVTIQCTGQGYTVQGTPKQPINFKPSGIEGQPELTNGPRHKVEYQDEWVMVETGKKRLPKNSKCFPNAESDATLAKIYEDGIAITVDCKQNPRLVQFIHREQVLKDGTLEGGQQYLTDPGDCINKPKYCRTTTPGEPAWHTDRFAGPSPYYGHYWTDCDSTTTYYDVPTFPNFDPEKYRLWRATFVSFVLCDGKVVRQINWTREKRSNVLGLLLPGEHYNVGKPTAPDAELVKKLQCLSKKEGFSRWPEPACGQAPAPEQECSSGFVPKPLESCPP
jgi:hypothetical protein